MLQIVILETIGDIYQRVDIKATYNILKATVSKWVPMMLAINEGSKFVLAENTWKM